jgi:hypothetical protein
MGMKSMFWGAVAVTATCGCALQVDGERAGLGGKSEPVGEVSQALEIEPCPTDTECWDLHMGAVHTRYYRCPYVASATENGQRIARASCTVDRSFALVGGGGDIGSQGSPGAMIYATYAALQGKTWFVESKDQVQTFAHSLRAYAIGLRLDGLSRSSLETQIRVDRSEPIGPLAHPSASITVTADRLVVGGGARAFFGGAGQLVTENYPISNGWRASSKDHQVSDPGFVQAYVLSLPKCPTGMSSPFCLKTKVLLGQSTTGTGYREAILVNPENSLMTGIGSRPGGSNRLLHDIYPRVTSDGFDQAIVRYKDHLTAASGTAEVHLITLAQQ